jgi:hypothetical protein
LRRARRRSMHKRPHSWCRGDRALCSVNVRNPARCLACSAGARALSAQAHRFASAGPTSRRTAAQLARLFDRSRASSAKFARIWNGLPRVRTMVRLRIRRRRQRRIAQLRDRVPPGATLRYSRAARRPCAASSREQACRRARWRVPARRCRTRLLRGARRCREVGALPCHVLARPPPGANWANRALGSSSAGWGPPGCVLVPIAKPGPVSEASSHAVRPTTPDAHAVASALPTTRRRRVRVQRQG